MSEQSAKSELKNKPSDWWYLLLLLPPIILYMAASYVLGITRNAEISFDIIPVGEFIKISAIEAQYRYVWISALSISICVSIFANVAGIFLFLNQPKTTYRHVLMIIAGFIAIVVMVGELNTGTKSGSQLWERARWYEYMGNELYQCTLGRIPVNSDPRQIPIEYSNCSNSDMVTESTSKESVLYLLDFFLNMTKLFAGLAFIFIVSGCVGALSTPRTPSPSNGGRTNNENQNKEFVLDVLSKQFNMLRSYLYLGTFVFAFATISMISWMFWPIPFLDGPDAQYDYIKLLSGTAIIQGTFYTLTFASIYVPPLIFLKLKVYLTVLRVSHGSTEKERRRCMRRHKLEASPVQDLKQIILVLMPQIIGLLPALLT